MKRTFRYSPDGTSYEVKNAPRLPAVHFLHTTDAIDTDGNRIPAARLRELNRQGKNFHIEEARNIAMDAHNEQLRKAKRDKRDRLQALADAVNGHGG